MLRLVAASRPPLFPGGSRARGSFSSRDLADLGRAFEPTFVLVTDESGGCGARFDVVLVSRKFEGVPLLDRQKAVNAQLAEEMKTIHALTMKTWTPEQFATRLTAGTVPDAVKAALATDATSGSGGGGEGGGSA